MVVFAIVVVIQFVVVTKGSTRISEVAARFALDAMPGKQLAIDADLAAKAITPAQAQQRREELSREADFYGAMDGASKFLRGEAVASVLILLVNLVGGVYIGLAQCGWGLSQTVGLFSRLTIGDGLVTQIPAFIVSLASALIVTRSAARSDLGEQVAGQLVSRPGVLLTAAGLIGLLALASLPALPLLLIGGGLVAMAVLVRHAPSGGTAGSNSGGFERESQRPLAHRPSRPAVDDLAPAAVSPIATSDAGAAKAVEDLLRVDPIRIELGYALVRLAEGEAAGESRPLLGQIEEVRRQIAAELGVVVPPVRVTDNLELGAHRYAIRIRGAKVAQSRAYVGQLLAVVEEPLAARLDGKRADDFTGLEGGQPAADGDRATWSASGFRRSRRTASSGADTRSFRRPRSSPNTLPPSSGVTPGNCSRGRKSRGWSRTSACGARRWWPRSPHDSRSPPCRRSSRACCASKPRSTTSRPSSRP